VAGLGRLVSELIKTPMGDAPDQRGRDPVPALACAADLASGRPPQTRKPMRSADGCGIRHRATAMNLGRKAAEILGLGSSSSFRAVRASRLP
jgi:hypothetical protein